MKRLTYESKKWNRIHIHHLNRRKVFKNTSKNTGKRQKKKKKVIIHCPNDFSLTSNFSGVIGVLDKIRQLGQCQRNQWPSQAYIDFKNIKQLSPAAALVLAAELDRWNKLRHGRLKPVDVGDWNPQVRRLLNDMGFFDLLQVANPPVDEDGDIKYVRFRTGTKADGKASYLLRKDDLDPLVGGMPKKHALYAAVTEAMTNVVHHAYTRDFSAPSKSWWLSASYDSDKREVTIMIYDQGLGIPETLPRNFSERLKNILVTDHARMIEVAHDLSRSSSGIKHRGYGLERDVRSYFERLNCHGHYRVISLRGEYILRKDSDGGTHNVKQDHHCALKGTLIEWRLLLI